jgi:D-ribulokinase
MTDSLYLGVDVGTSGVRTSVIDANGSPIASAACPMPLPDIIDGRPTQDPEIWWSAAAQCLRQQAEALKSAGCSLAQVTALAVDGTSGAMLLADAGLAPTTPGLMYNSAGFVEEAERIAAHAPPQSITRGASSALARMLCLQAMDPGRRSAFCLHQADWIAARLAGVGGHSDENNVLKLGYDLSAKAWPGWLADCGVRMELLPRAHPVGTPFAVVAAPSASAFGFSANACVCAGTTDSVAAFLASGADRIGDAVTSLGTTLAIKLLSDQPVADLQSGVYSHRVGAAWLAGGASNTGGGVLLRHFTIGQIKALSARIDPNQPIGCDFYPLSRPGERFPVNDPLLPPRLTPRPDDDAQFLHGMLEGMARIEAEGYRVLETLGCPYPKQVLTAGGGAVNVVWSRIRERVLGVPVVRAPRDDAATGAARLAAGLVRF